ncbi:hypothetical protein CXB51_004783 [Gossypium anomalum]|uniref:Sugar phosphate transporter domain-containing protein n=1 Tax=Gossypium anomalum TaxID=47600 RepID=A0A8J6DAW4_9ROSI|nr:hypothetical protein CXB51_004783 [Gossypium anomalum]
MVKSSFNKEKAECTGTTHTLSGNQASGLHRDSSFSLWIDEDGTIHLEHHSVNTSTTAENSDFELPMLNQSELQNMIVEGVRFNKFPEQSMHLIGDSTMDNIQGGDSAGEYVPFDIENESALYIGSSDICDDGDIATGSPKALPLNSDSSISLVDVLKLCSLYLYNKTLLGDDLGKFPAPLLMNTVHFTMQAVLSKLITWYWSHKFLPTDPMTLRDYFYKVVPTALSTALDVNLSNASLVFISVTFATMCKSATPIFLLLFAFAFSNWLGPLGTDSIRNLSQESLDVAFNRPYEMGLQKTGLFYKLVMAWVVQKSAIKVFPRNDQGFTTIGYVLDFQAELNGVGSVRTVRHRLESPSLHLLGIILVISVGILLTVSKETGFQFWGFVFVMLAAVMSGFRWCMTQILLQIMSGVTKNYLIALHKLNPLTFMSYVTPVMAVVTALLSLLLDPWDQFTKNSYFNSSWHIARSCFLMLFGGTLAFFMVLTEYILVSITSAVTVTIAGVVKEAVTILVAVFYLHDEFTWLKGAGLLTIMVGVSLFNWYKYLKLQKGKLEEDEAAIALTANHAAKYVILDEMED